MSVGSKVRGGLGRGAPGTLTPVPQGQNPPTGNQKSLASAGDRGEHLVQPLSSLRTNVPLTPIEWNQGIPKHSSVLSPLFHLPREGSGKRSSPVSFYR